MFGSLVSFSLCAKGADGVRKAVKSWLCVFVVVCDLHGMCSVCCTLPAPRRSAIDFMKDEDDRDHIMKVAWRQPANTRIHVQEALCVASNQHTHLSQGIVVMTQELDDVFVCLFDGRIPASWLKGYPSLKPLASWARDLVERIRQLSEWVEGTYPIIYNMGYFTFPTGFLTAVLQTSARKNSVSIDMLAVSVLNLSGLSAKCTYVHA